jgi:hypothetical protein
LLQPLAQFLQRQVIVFSDSGTDKAGLLRIQRWRLTARVGKGVGRAGLTFTTYEVLYTCQADGKQGSNFL